MRVCHTVILHWKDFCTHFISKKLNNNYNYVNGMEQIQTKLVVEKDNFLVVPLTTEKQIGIDFSETNGIWRDRESLNHGYTPRDVRILHREKEIKEFTSHLKDAIHNIVPGNLFVYGKSGTGKTMITKLVTSVLEKNAAERNIKLKTVYIHCATTKSNLLILRSINDSLEIDMTQKITKTANSFGVYFSKFLQLMKINKVMLILILDEMDKLKDPDIMNLFARVKESELLEQNICIIGITNDTKFEEDLDSRTMSVLGRRQIVFSPYNANQLRDILSQRAQLAFIPDVLDETVIPLCAAYAAQEHGDARRAIELMKLAATIAEEQNADRITESHVKSANERIDKNLSAEIITTLPTQSKLILLGCIIDGFKQKKGYVSHTSEIYNTYKEVCKMIGIEILTQRRMTDLLTELDTLSIINAKPIFKGRYGRTKEVTLTAPSQVYLSIVMQDYRINVYNKKIDDLIQFYSKIPS